MTENPSEDEKPIGPLFAVEPETRVHARLYEVPPANGRARVGVPDGPSTGKPRPGSIAPRRPSPPPVLAAILGFKPILTGERPEWTSVYRLYDEAEALLYVGMSNAPVERYIEHRETKDWWSQVTSHSIEWYMTRDEADEREVYTIKDEWPIHNIAHQPRGNGPFEIPSYVADVIEARIARGIQDVLPDVSEDDAALVASEVRAAFTQAAGEDDEFHKGEIEFRTDEAPTAEPFDLYEVIAALGQFRPPISSSMRADSAVFSVPAITVLPEVAAPVGSTFPWPPDDLVKAEINRRIMLEGRDVAKESRLVLTLNRGVEEHPWLTAFSPGSPEHIEALSILKTVADERQAQIAAEQADAPF